MGTFSLEGFTMKSLLLVLCAILAPTIEARLPYIVGGNDVAVPGTYPWQASLQPQGRYHSCGASLVSERWLVTAAHCVGNAASYYKVVLGMHDKDSRQEGSPIKYSVSNIIKHEKYSTSGIFGFPNDIALLQLSTDADTSSPFISTIAMADKDEDFAGNSECYITGWGRLYGDGPTPNVLQEAHVDVYTNEQCKTVHNEWQIGDYHVCTGKAGTSGSCNGDSGGPLACKVDGQWKLVGATSWGLYGCPTTAPSVYARVSYFRDWITEKTGL